MTTLKIQSNRKVWITSDTHYGHFNLCRGITKWRNEKDEIPIDETRDFPTLEKMNDTIVNNINSVVMQDDVLIHLGDWSFGGIENIETFRNRIICREVHIAMGNHDQHLETNKNDVRRFFDSVQDYIYLKYNKKTAILMHYPISSWNGIRKGYCHLHGHSHLPDRLKITNGRRMDVGLDGNMYFRPYDIMKVIEMLEEREIGSDMGGMDHHVDNLKNVEG
jgi:calcineurin-like phosphoesterase family protein